MANMLVEQGIKLLNDSEVEAFNHWRMQNLTFEIDISGKNFSGKDLSRAYLNGISCIGTDFSHCNLSKVNFVQTKLTRSNFEGANLSDALLMYAEISECCLVNCDMTRTNFMFKYKITDLTGSKLLKTNFVEANLKNVKVLNVDKKQVYLKSAKLEGTPWHDSDHLIGH